MGENRAPNVRRVERGTGPSQSQAGVLMRDEQVEPVAGFEEVGKPGEDRDPPDKLDILRTMGTCSGTDGRGVNGST